jgi:hypothetical protein
MLIKKNASTIYAVISILLSLFIAACGGDATNGSNSGNNSGTPVSLSYFKTTIGTGWTYSDGATEIITSNTNNHLTSERLQNGERTVTSTLVSGSALAVESTKTYDVTGALTDTTIYTPAYRFFPSSTTIGSTENQAVAYTSTASGSGTTNCSVTVKAKESVTVTAGTYQNALKVETSCSPGQTFNTWYAPGIGSVKEENVSNGNSIIQLTALATGTVTHAISGKVSLGNGTALSGVTVSTSGASATTNASGTYSLSGLTSGTYTVTAAKNGYNFTPATVSSYVNGADTANQDFTATVSTTPTYSISGTVTANSLGLAGVTISTTGASTTTDSSGAYTLAGLVNGSYTVTPSLTGYTFSPTARTPIINNANVTAQNFAATAVSVNPPPGSNACIPYKVGNNMTYSSSLGSSVGTITAVSGSNFTTQNSVGGMTITMNSISTGCDRSSMVSQTMSTTGYNLTNNWSPALPTLPASLATGNTETVTSTLTSSSSTVSCSGPQTVKFTVIGPESVTVTAGTFNAIKITSTTTINQTCTKGTGSGGSTDTQWFVPGLGTVKSQASTGEISQLASYTFN